MLILLFSHMLHQIHEYAVPAALAKYLLDPTSSHSSSNTAPGRAARHGYCNNFLYVLPFSSLVLHPFILNMVTRLVSLKCKSDSVLPLVTLQELPMSLRKSELLQQVLMRPLRPAHRPLHLSFSLNLLPLTPPAQATWTSFLLL